MIKLFRNIRQGLLSENNFSKYLLYALGEIVLVIVGILIALSINQHKTDQNNRDLRDLYLIQLNGEVDRNLKELNDYKIQTLNTLLELDTLYQILSKKEYDNPKLLSKSQYLIMGSEFSPILITYENLKFSGDLKLFDNLLMRDAISESYATFNYVKSVEKIDKEAVQVYYRDYLLPNARFMNMTLSSNKFGKDAYFENTVISRIITIRQIRDAVISSIESLEKLKIAFDDGKLSL